MIPGIWLVLVNILISATWTAGESWEALKSEDSGIIDSSTLMEDCENCTWNITAPKGMQLEIYMFKVNINNNPNCTKDSGVDYLVINETTSEKTKTLGFYCNNSTEPRIILSETSNVNITLHVTNKIKSKSKFYLIYKSFNASKFVNDYCNKTMEFREPSGVIMSPNYPGALPYAASCTYRIIQPPGMIIKLSIVHLDIRKNATACDNDLTVHDGDDETLPVIRKICDTKYYTSGFVVMSSTNYMFLQFKTLRALERNRGFYAVYEALDAQCGGFYRALRGTIQSPGFSSNSYYGNNLNCTWKIIGPPSHVILLKWSFLEMEWIGCSSGCDHITVSELLSNGTLFFVGRFNGRQLPASIVSSGNAININFITDSVTVWKGFSLDYTIINSALLSGGR